MSLNQFNQLEVTSYPYLCPDRKKEHISTEDAEVKAYKKVENRVKPVAITLPEQFRIVRRIPSDPLAELPVLPINPPEFCPGSRYTLERKDTMQVNPDGFLWPEEEKLVHHLILVHETAFAWDETKKGRFSDEYFDPVVIPTIEHIPWVLRNIPIPPGIYDQVIEVIKNKIESGIYEPSNSSYRSRWFCVLKKNGRSLRIVHDLQPLNAVTIRDSAIPPMVEHYAEGFGGRACYALFDLLVGFDQQALSPDSRDLTTFQTPLGTFRLTLIPMGYTNSMQIQHGDITFILQEEIPHVTVPFVDDIPVKGPSSRYQNKEGEYETVPENKGIRRFVWEHMLNVNRVIQRIKHAGGTFSAKKSFSCVGAAVIVGHKCTFEGREIDKGRLQKIIDWPICHNLTEVRGFLGTLGTVRIFIKDFATHAKPLVQLTKKDSEFVFDIEHLEAMEKLKLLAKESKAVRAINYCSGNEVTLAVDSSWMAVGYILSQQGDDGKRYPSRYGSITWNEREQKYSQAKIELYRLFRALKAVKIFVVGVANFTVEVDAKYIKGMINNPDIQPSAAINRWIAGILLFDFKLQHVPGKLHGQADGLSRRPTAPEDKQGQEVEDADDWIDKAYSLDTGGNDDMKGNRNRKSTDALELLQMLSVSEGIEEIPRNSKSQKKDRDIEAISDFLDDLLRLQHNGDIPFKQKEYLIKRASKFFKVKGQMWQRHPEGKHQLVISQERRLPLIVQAHNRLGHKGIYSVRTNLLIRFWWPDLERDVKWFVRTCHECQIQSMKKISIPATVATPGGLFRKIYVDTMLMPKSKGFRYIIHARCSLTAYPEWTMARTENKHTIAKFLLDIIYRWGAVEMIVTDNAPQFLLAAKILVDKYHVHHIRISPYNSRAAGVIERRHLDVREAIIKTADGDESKWMEVTPAVFWAERVTIIKSVGYSPYYMAHGIEPLLPFDLAEATHLAQPIQGALTTDDLIARRAKMLMKRPQDLQRVREEIAKARWSAVQQLEKGREGNINDFNFAPGTLVLVRNSRFDKGLTNKTKPRYLGPMVVLRKTKGGSYILGELDGAISKLRFAAFRLMPYLPRNVKSVPVTKLHNVSDEEMEELTHETAQSARQNKRRLSLHKPGTKGTERNISTGFEQWAETADYLSE